MLLDFSMRVRPIEGRMIVNPMTIGAGQHRRIGHTRVVDGKVFNMRTGQMEARIRYVFGDGSPEVVLETGDGYLRRAIHDGDLEYIEHVGPDGQTWIDDALLAVTQAHFPKAEEKPTADVAGAGVGDSESAVKAIAAATDTPLLPPPEGAPVEPYVHVPHADGNATAMPLAQALEKGLREGHDFEVIDPTVPVKLSLETAPSKS